MVHRAHEQRVAIRHGLGRDARAQRAASAATVVDHQALAREPRELRGHGAGKRIGAATGGERHDHGHRLGGPGGLGVCPGAVNGGAGNSRAQDVSAVEVVGHVFCLLWL
ncbi:hypothetical protein D9M68_859910 [compost metagenome]